MVSIYSISLKSNPNNIIYIGKTNSLLKYRLQQHIAVALKGKKGKFQNWIRKNLNLNEELIIEIVEEVENDNWEESEIYWIAQFKAWGFNLKNVDFGGSFSNISKEQKKVLIQRIKSRKLTKEGRKSIIDFCNSEAGKAKIKKAQEASKHKIIQIDKITGKKTYWNSVTEAAKQYPETKDSISAIGKVLKLKRKTYKKCYWIYQ